MRNLLLGIILGLSTFVLALSGFLYSANSIDAQPNKEAGQATCPDSDGWVKVENSNFEEIGGAVEYCFKAGPYVSYGNDYPEQGFGNPGGCSEANIEQCQLSHWSYRLASCLYPEGNIHAGYEEGWHQIVGGDRLWGSDYVYELPNGDYLQCYCADNGSGIQTYWWRTDTASLAGWFSENGEQWNLGDYHYLAKNTDYACPR